MAEYTNPNALEVYNTIKAYLDEQEYSYSDEDGKISLGFRGKDLSIDMNWVIDDRREVLCLTSQIPVEIPEDKVIDVIAAISAINYKLVLGSFVLLTGQGKVWFNLTAAFRECAVGTELIKDMLDCTYSYVDEYNDKIEAIATGELDANDFINELLG